MNFIQKKTQNRINDIEDISSLCLPYPEGIEKIPRTPLCDFFTQTKSSIELIMVHHCNEIDESFIRSLAQRYTIRKIICVPYSSVEAVVSRLKKDFDLVVPESLHQLSQYAKEAVDASDKSVIIQDVGAYTSDIAEFLDDNPKVLGVVDVTMHGYWKWEKKKLKRLPVLSIAKSRLKGAENSTVGKNIINSTTYFLQQNNLGQLSDKNILVIGFGNIGKEICKYIKPFCKTLSIYDRDPIKMIELQREYGAGIDWKQIDIVFCITGQEFSVHYEDLQKFKSGVIFISASSKQVEFDLKAFKEKATRMIVSDSFIDYEFNDQVIHVANHGEPINFRHVFLPGYALEPAYAGMIKCMQRLERGYSVPGLMEILPEDERDVAVHYLDIYSNKQ